MYLVVVIINNDNITTISTTENNNSINVTNVNNSNHIVNITDNNRITNDKILLTPDETVLYDDEKENTEVKLDVNKIDVNKIDVDITKDKPCSECINKSKIIDKLANINTILKGITFVSLCITSYSIYSNSNQIKFKNLLKIVN